MTSGISRILLALAAVAVIGGCVRSEQLYEGTHVASVGNLTAQNRSLREIAPPAQRQIVAVYDFPDLTGQYKERDRVQSLSRAVTQAGAPLLIKALQDASNGRWFSVLDRSSLEAVVQERQIIERMRQQYRGEQNVNPAVLGPLMHAGIIITGGVGARYLGIGANREWKYDVVSVNIRAVSTETGEVLANVVARKPIASIKDQGDVFRYIELDKLLEAEAGYSTNEPRQIAVQQSVEKAVMGLIAEGAMRNIWSFDSEEAERKFISGYRQELFNGEVPPSARAAAARPATRKAAAIPQTRPVKRAEDIRTRRNRPKTEPDPPPPPRQDEVLG
jgi:curli production assembly/transport component CsgG